MSAQENDADLAKLAGLLDFYSDRAVAHASFFIACIFGLITFSAMIFGQFNSILPLYFLSTVLFFGFAYVGYHTLMRFSFYAAFSQKIAEIGLKQGDVLSKAKIAETTSAGIEYSNLLLKTDELTERQRRWLLFNRFTSMIGNIEDARDRNKKRSLPLNIVLLWSFYWVSIALLGSVVFNNHALEVFLSIIVIAIALTVIIPYFWRIKSHYKHCPQCGIHTCFDAKFCQKCGKPTTSNSIESNPVIVCDSCKTENEKEYGKNYCRNCGKEFVELSTKDPDK